MNVELKVIVISIILVIAGYISYFAFFTGEDEADDQSYEIARSTELMKQYFKTFDSNYNGVLEYFEAEELFFTVELNAPYRYDDEYKADPHPYCIVGDGRMGSDYHQLPLETFAESAGDCEDFAILEAAFFEYWGVEAYVASVDTEGTSYSNHMLCLVNIGSSEGWAEALGHPVHTYVIKNEEYLLVDNAYSEDFGAIYYNGEYHMLNGIFKIHNRMSWQKAALENTPSRSELPEFPGVNHWVSLDELDDIDEVEHTDDERQELDETVALDDGWDIKKPIRSEIPNLKFQTGMD